MPGNATRANRQKQTSKKKKNLQMEARVIWRDTSVEDWLKQLEQGENPPNEGQGGFSVVRGGVLQTGASQPSGFGLSSRWRKEAVHEGRTSKVLSRGRPWREPIRMHRVRETSVRGVPGAGGRRPVPVPGVAEHHGSAHGRPGDPFLGRHADQCRASQRQSGNKRSGRRRRRAVSNGPTYAMARGRRDQHGVTVAARTAGFVLVESMSATSSCVHSNARSEASAWY